MWPRKMVSKLAPWSEHGVDLKMATKVVDLMACKKEGMKDHKMARGLECM